MKRVDSPNHGPRRGCDAPDLIVIHYTAMEGGPGPAIKRLCLPEAEVSAHYVIGEAGDVTQLVAEDRRAWHAGAASWGGVADVNSRSIGIELSNNGYSPFPAPQMDALEDLLRGAMARHGIGPAGVIGHSDCAPGRKIDPGPRFDWARLARQGLALGHGARGPVKVDESAFLDRARACGWTAEVELDVLLSAIRLRFRPWATGPLDGWDCAIMASLADV